MFTRKRKWATPIQRKRTSDVLFRLAERLFTVGVATGAARIVIGGEVTVTTLGAMLLAGGVVTLLLLVAHHLNKKGE
jgi:hypothetical protein